MFGDTNLWRHAITHYDDEIIPFTVELELTNRQSDLRKIYTVSSAAGIDYQVSPKPIIFINIIAPATGQGVIARPTVKHFIT